jgi:hypothetical protein
VTTVSGGIFWGREQLGQYQLLTNAPQPPTKIHDSAHLLGQPGKGNTG